MLINHAVCNTARAKNIASDRTIYVEHMWKQALVDIPQDTLFEVNYSEIGTILWHLLHNLSSFGWNIVFFFVSLWLLLFGNIKNKFRSRDS